MVSTGGRPHGNFFLALGRMVILVGGKEWKGTDFCFAWKGFAIRSNILGYEEEENIGFRGC